ncbi:MAG: SGNH/GDSL hydrolase family protein, partial [Chthoniobacteraceae bacterium]|nr:SGNH/GDSL hydrolase family protein [Chthoniobacteraceae bacterium]
FGIGSHYNAQVIFSGDSIVAGFQINDYDLSGTDDRERSWPFQLQLDLGRSDICYQNAGVASQTAAQCVLRDTNRLDTLLMTGVTNVAVMAAGINDIALGTTANALWQQATNWSASRHRAGWNKTVVVDLIPCASVTGGAETYRIAYNALVAANWSTWFDGYVPASTNTWTAPAFQSDVIHPSAAGRALFSATAIDQLRSLLP